MSEIYTPSKENFSASTEMSFTAERVAAEMRGHVSNVVALCPGESRKQALAYAAKLLRLPLSRVKCLFYGEARRIEAHEADQIRAYVQQAEDLFKAQRKYEQDRLDYISAHPIMGRLAPPSLETQPK